MKRATQLLLMILLLSLGMILPTLASNSDVYPNVTDISTYKTVFPISSIYAYGIQNGQQFNLMQSFNVDLIAHFMGSGDGSTSWRENSSTWNNEKGWSELQWDNNISRINDTALLWTTDYVSEGDFNYLATISTNNLTYTFEPFAYSTDYIYPEYPTAYMGYANQPENSDITIRVSFDTNILNIAGARETVHIERQYNGTLNNNTIGIRLFDQGIINNVMQQLGQSSIVICNYNVQVTIPSGNLRTLRLINIVDSNAPTIESVMDEIDTSFEEQGNWFNAIVNAVDGFMNAELFGEGQFTLGGLLICVLGIAVFLAFLKIFAGG